MSVYVVQCLCPQRHCIAAIAYEANEARRPGTRLRGLRRNRLRRGSFSSRAGTDDGSAVTRHNPQTREEWQEAVDAAAAFRAIADCKMYGLIEGGPKIDAHRCDEILRRGRRRGFAPSRPVTDLAVGMIDAINAEADEKAAIKPGQGQQ